MYLGLERAATAHLVEAPLQLSRHGGLERLAVPSEGCEV